ncbi:hypothetical protein GEV33_003968 [Tenebrio molitor]|uniref:Uncharacterized protein n=1 Tax=Tenebrio molitor TaxID=7067 RepID=A0A8J6HSI5_TENMO|nr:hypothetical protein GEV33_003968 [Tenebrio molitor]
MYTKLQLDGREFQIGDYNDRTIILIEFGDTPSSALTLEEFMTVDLEEEQDPPSFKAARKKDKERLQRLMEEEAESITELQQEIEMQLNRNARMKCRKN